MHACMHEREDLHRVLPSVCATDWFRKRDGKKRLWKEKNQSATADNDCERNKCISSHTFAPLWYLPFTCSVVIREDTMSMTYYYKIIYYVNIVEFRGSLCSCCHKSMGANMSYIIVAAEKKGKKSMRSNTPFL